MGPSHHFCDPHKAHSSLMIPQLLSDSSKAMKCSRGDQRSAIRFASRSTLLIKFVLRGQSTSSRRGGCCFLVEQ